MGNMMKQMQKMQADMAKVEQELAETKIEATAGGAAVKAVVTGKQEVVEIIIDPSVVDPEDVEMLQDLVVAAVNEALATVQAEMAQEMSKVTGGINIPGLM